MPDVPAIWGRRRTRGTATNPARSSYYQGERSSTWVLKTVNTNFDDVSYQSLVIPLVILFFRQGVPPRRIPRPGSPTRKNSKTRVSIEEEFYYHFRLPVTISSLPWSPKKTGSAFSFHWRRKIWESSYYDVRFEPVAKSRNETTRRWSVAIIEKSWYI
jgi:hypothetical protein